MEIFGGELEISSTPEKVEIWVRKDTTSKGKKIGETPFKGDSEVLFQVDGDTLTPIVELRKPGYEDYRLMMVQGKSSIIKLDVVMIVSAEIRKVKEHDSLISELFKVQKMIRSRNYGDALAKLELIEKDHPHMSIIPELKGITHYMNKKPEQALSMFRLAFSLNPDNVDAFKMKIYLEKKLNIDAEAKL